MKNHDTKLRNGKNKTETSHSGQKTTGGCHIPPIPLISLHSGRQVGHRDTLERVASVLELLTELDYGKGLSPNAETGLYWVHMMLIESLNHVSRALETDGHL